MVHNKNQDFVELQPKLSALSMPGKALVTMIVLIMSVGLFGAVGQIIVHDVIPTFWGKAIPMEAHSDEHTENKFTRGDIFETASPMHKAIPFYQTHEFMFVLKFVHIHLFGMSLIFIFMGGLVFFLDLSPVLRTWLIVLPFIGVIIDLASVWLKVFIHPAFFWLHIPGGALFGIVFSIDSVLIIQQLWRKEKLA